MQADVPPSGLHLLRKDPALPPQAASAAGRGDRGRCPVSDELQFSPSPVCSPGRPVRCGPRSAERTLGFTTWSCSKTTSRLVYSIELSAPGQSGVNRPGKEHAGKVGAGDNRPHNQFPEADGDCRVTAERTVDRSH
jgi:hypothetical protein